MLVVSNVFPSGNLYSVTHTDIQPRLSFLDHLTEIGKALSLLGWEQREPFAVSDPSTSFKMQCNHEPHSVLVLLPGSRNLMITVRCSEPQRIHELMKKYGLTCSGVFDSTIPSDDPFCDEPGLSNFYNTRHVQIRARRSTLRHKPYPSQHLTGDLEDFSIRIALYYNAHSNDLIRVIKEDGRFLEDVQCAAPGTAQWMYCTQHLRPGSVLTLGTGAWDSDDSEGFDGETAPIGDPEDSDITVDSEDETASIGDPEDSHITVDSEDETACKNTVTHPMSWLTPLHNHCLCATVPSSG
ncbi:hypothetical protein KUCAC02_033062 [Chaenocephalus aceratus]|nr:hypothetical protein KUCAC02_033062 [Chaenocephalus aceratus]